MMFTLHHIHTFRRFVDYNTCELFNHRHFPRVSLSKGHFSLVSYYRLNLKINRTSPNWFALLKSHCFMGRRCEEPGQDEEPAPTPATSEWEEPQIHTGHTSDFGNFLSVRWETEERRRVGEDGLQGLLQPVMVMPTSAGDRACSQGVRTNPGHRQGKLGTDPDKKALRTEHAEGRTNKTWQSLNVEHSQRQRCKLRRWMWPEAGRATATPCGQWESLGGGAVGSSRRQPATLEKGQNCSNQNIPEKPHSKVNQIREPRQRAIFSKRI